MPNRLPKNIADSVKFSVYKAADEVKYMSLSRSESGQFMDELVKRSDIGGVLESYIARPQIRTYIKDGILNRYTKEKAGQAYKLNFNAIIKKEFGFAASESDAKHGVMLFRSQNFATDDRYVLVSKGTVLKWETALKKALCFIAGAPFSKNEKSIQILLILYSKNEVITPADKKLLDRALMFCGAKAHIVGE